MSLPLHIESLVAGYGEMVVLDGISLDIPAGRTVAVLGRNGVGKTTLLTTIMGQNRQQSGSIRLGDTVLDGLPTHRRVEAGLGYVPQEREIFPSLSAEENLAIAARPGGWTAEKVYDLFPGLMPRRKTGGNRLSGGEQQMLAIGRALVGGPKMLLLDEPMEGLAPIVVENLYSILERLKTETGLTILLVEQKADLALSLAEEVIVLNRGRIIHTGPADVLHGDQPLQAQLLGMGVDQPV